MPLINSLQNQMSANDNQSVNGTMSNHLLNKVQDQNLAPTTDTFPITPNFVTQNEIRQSIATSEISQEKKMTPLKEKFSTEKTSIQSYMEIAFQKSASDLHFSVGHPPILRVDGQLEKIPGSNVLSKERGFELFKNLMGDMLFAKLIKEKEVDFSVSYRAGIRFRVNVFFESGNISAAFRLINSDIKTIEELYLPEILHDFVNVPHGLILATGPTGSGKSTTLAAIINEINLSSAKHIITIEDPIEYIFPKAQALVDQREVGKDTISWEKALRSAMRQDPDVVMVGEMRDYETIAATITLAETGHLVFSTLHTNSASQAIDRMIDVFPEHQQTQIRGQLANVLSAVISQRLIPLKNGGRRVAIEILIGTSAVKNAIREGKTYQIDNMILTGSDVGMISLEKSLAKLVSQGILDLNEALAYTVRPDELKQLVGIGL